MGCILSSLSQPPLSPSLPPQVRANIAAGSRPRLNRLRRRIQSLFHHTTTAAVLPYNSTGEDELLEEIDQDGNLHVTIPISFWMPNDDETIAIDITLTAKDLNIMPSESLPLNSSSTNESVLKRRNSTFSVTVRAHSKQNEKENSMESLADVSEELMVYEGECASAGFEEKLHFDEEAQDSQSHSDKNATREVQAELEL